MKHNLSPWPPEHRLTPELFDSYVARAREERAKAIAEFGRQLASAVVRMAQCLGRRTQSHRRNPAGRAGLLTR
jgi:hypothetical protein